MIRLEQVKLPIGYDDAVVRAIAADVIRIPLSGVLSARVVKQSVDARHKPNLTYVATLAVETEQEGKLLKNNLRLSPYVAPPTALSELDFRRARGTVLIVGAGPSGLFCALTLAKNGVKPIIVERGSDVDKRTLAVESLRERGEFSARTNIQFGEGGAGTFSDGKLTTGTASPFSSAVIGEFIAHGAPREIGYLAHPHIGTDYLANVVKAIRGEICALGGEVCFDTQAIDFILKDNRIHAVELKGARSGRVEADAVVLAVGHSARDTYETLRARKVPMQQKAFSVGVRVEHLQTEVDKAQYGTALPPFAAEYKTAVHLGDGRGVYTFCMCPGGEVVMAASEEGGIATNGMSKFARNGQNANAAVLVGVDSRDYGDDLLGGVAFQRTLERAAYAVSNSYCAPVQRVDDFLKKRVTDRFDRVTPTIRPTPVCADLNGVLPPNICAALKDGMAAFAKKASFFKAPDALMTGVETRSSAPVRILRGDDFASPVEGLYPCGEGAGYAGGIMSAATDGVRVAEAILKRLGD